jgi:hypothetical protein
MNSRWLNLMPRGWEQQYFAQVGFCCADTACGCMVPCASILGLSQHQVAASAYFKFADVISLPVLSEHVACQRVVSHISKLTSPLQL